MRRLDADDAALLDVLEATAGLLDDVLRDAARSEPPASDVDDHHALRLFRAHRSNLRARASEHVNAVAKLSRSCARPIRETNGGAR